MRSSYPHPIIASEGWPFLAAAVAVALIVAYLWGWWSVPFWLMTLFILQFFRDPPRNVPNDPEAVVSPADGRIVAVEKSRDPYLDRDSLKISVFMNVFDVHSNRSPVDGEVKKGWYYGGTFLNAALDKASLENERNALWIRTDRRRGRHLRTGRRTRSPAASSATSSRMIVSRAGSASASSVSDRGWMSICRPPRPRAPRSETGCMLGKPFWRGFRPINRI